MHSVPDHASIATQPSRLFPASNFAIASFVMIVMLLLNGRIVAYLAGLWWESATYSHGLLILPTAAYAWWRVRTGANQVRANPQILGFVALAVLTGGILLCELALLQTGSAALLPAALLAAVYAALGWSVARFALVPVLLFFCAVPLWSIVTPYLQFISSVASAAIASLLGVLLVRSGNTIEIASGVFEVAPGCSGTNFLLCALSVSLLMGEIYSLRLRGRLALITTGIAIAMAANWFRIVTLVVLGDRTRMQSYLVAEEHYTFGWAAFAVALFAWILVVSRVLDKHREHTAEARSNSNADRIKSNGGNTIAAILALTIAAIGTVWIAAMADLPKSREPTMAEVLPAIPGWNGPLAEEGFWRPKFLGSDREWQGMYRSGGTDVLVYRNAYLSETPGRELVSSQNRLTPDGWQLRQTREGRIAIATEPTGEEWLIASWMLVGDGVADNAIRAKIMKAFYLLRRMPVPAGITVVATPCDDDCDAANAAVGSFLTAARWPEKSGMGESRNDLASDQANAP